MSVPLFLLERHLPGALRRLMFRDLVRLTAEAFGTAEPDVYRLPPDEAVAAFAAFTRREVEHALGAGAGTRVDAIKGRLHENSRTMGASLRRRLGIVTPAEAFRALQFLYRVVGIEVDADSESGAIAVRRCAFSAAYTPTVCAFISAIDAGIVSGITGGDTLIFTERITEGARCCRALVTAGESH